MAAELDASKVFPQTTRFKASLELINGVEEAKFPIILGRIIKKLHLKDRKPFSEEEEEQLSTMLGITAVQLRTILDACSFVFEQSAYFNLNGKKLARLLAESGVTKDKALAFMAVWEENERAFLQEVKQKTLVPYVLDGTRWQLHMQLAQSDMSRMQQPSAIFQLSLLPTDTDATEAQNIKIEFNHEELYEFYQKLEKIQEQLDNLGLMDGET